MKEEFHAFTYQQLEIINLPGYKSITRELLINSAIMQLYHFEALQIAP